MLRKFSSAAGSDSIVVHESVAAPKGVALLFGWMMSSHKQLAKYAKPYTEAGYHCIAVTPRPQHVMLPSANHPLLREVATTAASIDASSPVVSHACSVGGFLYASMLQLSAQTRGAYLGIDTASYVQSVHDGGRSAAGFNAVEGVPHRTSTPNSALNVPQDDAAIAALLGRIQGVVFDSPVDYFGVPDGLAFATLPTLPTLRPIVSKGIDLALQSVRSVREFHLCASHRFYYDVPNRDMTGLIIYSEADHVAALDPILEVHDVWSEQGMHSRLRVFADSKHVLHQRQYPEQYRAAVVRFLARVQGEHAR